MVHLRIAVFLWSLFFTACSVLPEWDEIVSDDDASDDDTSSGDDDSNGGDDDTGSGDDDSNGGDDDTGSGDDDANDDDAGDDDTGDDDTGDDDAASSCHPWHPIDVPGAQWVYSTQYNAYLQGALTCGYGTDVVQTGGSTYFQGYLVYQLIGTFTGKLWTADWWEYNTCDAGGNTNYGSTEQFNAAQYESNTTLNSPEVLFLPYDPDQQIGYTWISTFTKSFDHSVQGTGSYAANYNWEVVGMESTSVAAGTFNAVHIHADYTFEDFFGSHVGTLDTYWAEGIGLVKWDDQRPAEAEPFILRELQSYAGL